MTNRTFHISKKYFIFFIIFLCAACFIPVGGREYQYQSVLLSDALDPKFLSAISLKSGDDHSKEYIIRNDKLFLKSQTVQALVLFTYASDFGWTKEKLVNFRKAHPELESMWDSQNEGVFWIDKK